MDDTLVTYRANDRGDALQSDRAIDRKTIQQASAQVGDRIVAFTYQFAAEIGAAISKDVEEK